MKARKIRTMDREGNVVDVLGLVGAQGADGQPGADGTTPHIGENGNWFIGDTDTGVPARGEGGGSGSGIIAETDPTVFVWAKSHLPFTVAQLSAMASGAGFVVNPTNFADGKTYFRYHAGATSFTWTNPNPQRGAVTITVLAWSQYGDKSIGDSFSRLIVVYGDGTTEPIWLINGQTVTMTTAEDKVLAEIRGNYDHENWVLLDMDVLTIAADYPAPTGTVKSVNGVEPDEDGNVEIDIPEGSDANAVHYTAETPTEEQRMQARKNLELYYSEQEFELLAEGERVFEFEAIALENEHTLRVVINKVVSGGSLQYTVQHNKYYDYGSDITLRWYGNSNIAENQSGGNAYETNTDMPFAIWRASGGMSWNFYFDESMLAESDRDRIGVYSVEIRDTLSTVTVYQPIPEEYLPALTGATSDTDGESGLVPAPAAGDEGKFLAGDGTWKTPESSGGGSGTASEKEWKLLRNITLPEDPSTDTSDIEWTMCKTDNYTDQIASFAFSTDENGEVFAVRELLIFANHAYGRTQNYFGIANQNGKAGYGNLFCNRMVFGNKSELSPMVIHIQTFGEYVYTTLYEADAYEGNGVLWTNYNNDGQSTNAEDITAVKIGTFDDSSIKSGASYEIWGR